MDKEQLAVVQRFARAAVHAEDKGWQVTAQEMWRELVKYISTIEIKDESE